MFENITYEDILEEMLTKAVELYPDLDTREGSVLYTALAPAAVEIVNLYIALETVLDMSFPDTATRDFLIRRCAERGITPSEATNAVVTAYCLPEDVNIPTGTRFNCDGVIYAVTGEMIDSCYLMECETSGRVGNKSGGVLIPLEYIEGLTVATIAELVVAGADDEDTESLRARYYDSFDSQSFGGNVKDYKEKVLSISGVGGVKVFPTYAGGGTVKIVIMGSDYSVPSDTLVNSVQTALDPLTNSGEGLGLAPIGHSVIVAAVTEKNVSTKIGVIYADGWSWSDLKPYVENMVDSYFTELNAKWADMERIVLRISQLEARLFELEGIEDITYIAFNGDVSNVSLGENEVLTRGSIYE